MPPIKRHLRFFGPQGHHLAARYERPVSEPIAHVLFAHCFSCTKDLKSVNWISHTLTERGYAVLRFDFTGVGESEGDFGDTNFSTNLDDLVAAADMLREHYAAPRLLIGHSLGGTACLAAAKRIPESRAVVTIAAPSSTGHLSDALARHSPEIEAKGEARVGVMGRVVRITRQLLDNLREHNISGDIASLERALLVLHAPEDQVVGIDHAERIFTQARQPKSFVSLHQGDHLMVRDESLARYAAEIIAAWAARFID